MTDPGDRLAPRLPIDLSASQRELYDEIIGGPRAQGAQLFALTDERGALQGPFNAMLLSPGVGSALQSLGAAVRYGTTLSPRLREMAILLVAAHWDSGFERYAHEAVGRSVGVTTEELEALRRGDLAALPATSCPDEAAGLALVTALLRRSDLDDAEYAAARETVGERQVFELTALVGYYATLALALRVFRVGTPSAPA